MYPGICVKLVFVWGFCIDLPAPREVPWHLCQTCVCLGFCIDTAGSGPERIYQQWDLPYAIQHHRLSSESMFNDDDVNCLVGTAVIKRIVLTPRGCVR